MVAVVDKVVGRHTCYTTRLRARLLCLTFTLLKRNFPKTSGLPNPDLTPKKNKPRILALDCTAHRRCNLLGLAGLGAPGLGAPGLGAPGLGAPGLGAPMNENN